VECLVQGFNGIEPCSFDADWGVQTPGQITIWHEISSDTAENRHHLSGNIVTDQRKRSLSPNWLSLHAIPKLGNLTQSFARFVAGDDGAVNRTDRSADDPVRLDSGSVQRLINATLICAERAPALKHQYNLSWKRWCCLCAIIHDVILRHVFRRKEHKPERRVWALPLVNPRAPSRRLSHGSASSAAGS